MPKPPSIAAIVAAAGRSTRMGRSKQLLPWQDSTVIAVSVENLTAAGARPIVVVTGHEAPAVEAALADSAAVILANDEFAHSEMLRSFQVGLHYLASLQCIAGSLLALGDQPHIPADVLRQIIDEADRFPAHIIIPSHAMRRGHPIFLPASLWEEVMALDVTDTLRSTLNRHGDIIRYVVVDTPAVLRDLDTPDDYEALRPA